MLNHRQKLKEGYKVAGCCSPKPNDPIIGYFSHNNIIVVHRTSCNNLKKIETKRLFSLSWEEILEKKEEKLENDYYQLDELDFRILQHHQMMGVDYSLMVAKILKIEPKQTFERHRKLKSLKLLKRVEKVMIQYRKNVVDNKWIKHRNHTYYQITPKGERYLDYFISPKAKRL
jgi:hypothetical protein